LWALIRKLDIAKGKTDVARGFGMVKGDAKGLVMQKI